VLIVQKINPFLALPVAILSGMAVGLFTGVLNTKLRIAPLLAGILTMIGLYSINLRIMGRPNISLSAYLGHKTIINYLKSLPLPFPDQYLIPLILLFTIGLLKVLIDLFLHTEFGLALRATGDNENMIRAQGANTETAKIVGLGIANALVALSGALFAQYQGFSDVGMGIGMIISGLASVIIGEALIRGRTVGMGTLGVIVGAIVYRLAIALALKWGYIFNFRPSDLKLLTAVIVILALSFPYIRSKWKLNRLLTTKGKEDEHVKNTKFN
jgi:putative ABC transport system permease protein